MLEALFARLCNVGIELFLTLYHINDVYIHLHVHVRCNNAASDGPPFVTTCVSVMSPDRVAVYLYVYMCIGVCVCIHVNISVHK